MEATDRVHTATRGDAEDRFYLRCQAFLPEVGRLSRCPICGHGSDPGDSATYLREPRFETGRYWLPGLRVAATAGSIAYGAVAVSLGFGYALSLSLPVALRAILGFGTRTSLKVLAPLGGLIRAGVLLSSLLLPVSVIFVLLACLLAAPCAAGSILGALLRQILKASTWSQQFCLP